MDDTISLSFNAHDLDGLMSLFARDVEFYHDTQGLQDFRKLRQGFSALFSRNKDISRERVGTLEVYPIPGYGALEIGVHRFCHEESGRRDCGSFAFTQVWRHDPTRWHLTRVISYGH